ICVFLFFFLSMRFTLAEVGGNYSGFFLLSETFLKKNPYLRRNEELKSTLIIYDHYGYDGQFYYNMVFDPWLTYYEEKPNKYRTFFDMPIFRYRRIGYPALAKLFSMDRPESYPQTMILLLLFSHAVGALFVANMALHFKRNVWWTLLYVLVPGFTVSFRYGLPESMAAALLLGGTYFYLKKRLLLATLFFSCSLLTRETGALVIAVIILFELFEKRNWRSAFLMMSAFVPYFLWRGYVTWKLLADFGWAGFFYEPANFAAPFFGIGQLWYRLFSGQPVLDSAATAIFFPVLLIVAFISSLWILMRRKNFLTWSFFAYSALAVSLDYEKVWVGVLNAERHTYESFVMLLASFLSLKEEASPARFLPLLVFFLAFLYDWCCLTTAATFRAGLLSILMNN
ncbi:MAG TPA: hypothetical protein VI958_08725, partial [Acidobacteriota bacterium]